MEIIQIPLTDQQTPMCNVRTRTFFIVNHLLDESVLRNALDHLIRNHWRKLGARLVQRAKDGLFEYHLPPTFGEDYLLFKWTSQTYDHSVDKVSIFAKPDPIEGRITLRPALATFESWLRPSDWPIERQDAPSDAPLIYVHFVLFNDATTIALSWPHAVGDQFGVANVMKAWMDQVQGVTPPDMVGFRDDVLENQKSYKDYRPEEVVRKGRKRVRGQMEYPFVILGFLPELIMHSKEITHTMLFPTSLLKLLRQRLIKELEEKYAVVPEISFGDVITAVCLKVCLRLAKRCKLLLILSLTLLF